MYILLCLLTLDICSTSIATWEYGQTNWADGASGPGTDRTPTLAGRVQQRQQQQKSQGLWLMIVFFFLFFIWPVWIHTDNHRHQDQGFRPRGGGEGWAVPAIIVSGQLGWSNLTPAGAGRRRCGRQGQIGIHHPSVCRVARDRELWPDRQLGMAGFASVTSDGGGCDDNNHMKVQLDARVRWQIATWWYTHPGPYLSNVQMNGREKMV